MGLIRDAAGKVHWGAFEVGSDPTLTDTLGDRRSLGLEFAGRVPGMQRRAMGIGDTDLYVWLLFLEADAFIRKVLGPNLFGTGDESLASATGRLVAAKGLQLGVAESCTGGLISSRVTEVPGSSQWFAGGAVVYANRLKQSMLGVPPELLERYGAVSAETAQAMAAGVIERLHCDVAVAATGIAGPDGGSAGKPVGTVYLGLCYRNKVSSHLYHFSGSRRQIQEKTAHAALDLVRRAFLAQ